MKRTRSTPRRLYPYDLSRVRVEVNLLGDPALREQQERVRDALQEAILEASGDRRLLELRRSVEDAPDDQTREQVVGWADGAGLGEEVLEHAVRTRSPGVRRDVDAWSVVRRQ